MKHESVQRGVVGSLVTLLLMALWTASAAAQDPPPPGAAETPPPAAAAENGAAKKPRGRLPAYYGKVVTDKQREEIYAIQAKFNEEIAKLQEQLETLSTKRDTEIEKVLTDEQRAEIARFKSERKARRAERFVERRGTQRRLSVAHAHGLVSLRVRSKNHCDASFTIGRRDVPVTRALRRSEMTNDYMTNDEARRMTKHSAMPLLRH